MKIESYAVACDACGGKGFIEHELCWKCGGDQRVIVSQERRLLESAINNFVRAGRSFRAAVRGLGVKP